MSDSQQAGPLRIRMSRAKTSGTDMLRMGAVFALLAPCAFFLVWMLGWTSYGLDLSDEGSYLNWIYAPHLYRTSITQYGYVYHYLFHPFLDDISLLRIANLILTLALGTLFGFVLLLRFDPGSESSGVVERLAMSVPLAFASLLFVGDWLPTPSYNSLNLQGLLIAATALLLIGNRSSGLSRLGCVMLAVGGWVTFLAKPSSAMLLAVVALVYLTVTAKLTWARLILTGAISALLLTIAAFVIDGGVAGFSSRIADALSIPSMLAPHYGISKLFRFDGLSLPTRQWALLLGSAVMVAAATLFCGSAKPALTRLGVALCLGIALVPVAILVADSLFMPSGWQYAYGLQILAVPLGIVVVLSYRLRQRRLSAPTTECLAVSATLWWFPYVFAFGSSNEYWKLASCAGIFWVASALVLMLSIQKHRLSRLTLAPIVVSCFSISTAVLIVGMEHPYRQTQPIRLNDERVTVSENGRRVVLSENFARYLNGLRQIAEQEGFRTGTPMIDLTGHYPGTLFVLGGQAVGQAWMIGGYPGSERLASVSLASVPCGVLAASWLLTEPDGPRAIPQSVLGDFGMRHEIVGSFDSPTGSYRSAFRQHLLRPLHDHDAVTAACERHRS